MRRLGIALVAVTLCIASVATAYVLWLPRWPSATATVYYGGLGGFGGSLASAAGEWTSKTSFSFQARSNDIGACDIYGTLLNGAEFYPRDCSGSILGTGVLAVTECEYIGSRRTACGITFSSYETWDIYSGPENPFFPDFRRVALHELGHFLGLGHEDRVASIMSTYVGNTTALQADDIAGVAAIYGAPGSISVSPGDGFAATGPQGGPFTPSSRTYTIRNSGGRNVSYAVSEGSSWMGLSRTGGSLAPGASANVTVSLAGSAASLAQGTFNGSVSFTNTTNGSGNTSRSVALSVTAPPDPPAITDPAPGSTLASASVQFEWASNGTAASEWWLYVGPVAGSNAYHDSGSLGGAIRTTVSGLPTDGSIVHARLFWRVGGGTWSKADFQFSAADIPPPPPPAITSPLPGAMLAGAAVDCSWTSNGHAVSQWWLYLGPTPGSNAYYDSGSLGAATQTTVSGLPTDGSAVHARLFWRNGAGPWMRQDFQFVAADLPPPPAPEITSPAPGSTLPGATVSWQWTANGTPVTQWWLYLGSSPGSRAYHDSGSLGAATQTTVTGLPTDGRVVHARLFWRNASGPWMRRDFQFDAADLPPPPAPEIISPAPGSTLPGTTATWQWTANGTPVTEWWLYLGSRPGSNAYHDSGSLGAATQTTVTGLPTDGRTVHARLYWRNGSAPWMKRDFQFDAADLPPPPGPEISTPAPGSTLAGSVVTFAWTANGSPVAEWWIYVGSSAGAKDHLDSGSLGSAVQHTVSGLPLDGGDVHVRLFWRRAGGSWMKRDFVFVAAKPPSFDTALFADNAVGDFLSYAVDGTGSARLEFVGTEAIAGTDTIMGVWTGGPNDRVSTWVSYDPALGGLLWRNRQDDVFIQGLGAVSQLQEFAPPLLVAGSTITIGETQIATTRFVQTFFTSSGDVVQPGSIRAEVSYPSLEQIDVPFGSFEAIRRETTLQLDLDSGGSATVFQRDWLVPGIGPVRAELSLPGGVQVLELVDTNRGLAAADWMSRR